MTIWIHSSNFQSTKSLFPLAQVLCLIFLSTLLTSTSSMAVNVDNDLQHENKLQKEMPSLSTMSHFFLEKLIQRTTGNTKEKKQQYLLKKYHLGIMVDGGRHYFPLQWWHELLQILSILRYDIIHLRLTDDQLFVWNSTYYPQTTMTNINIKQDEEDSTSTNMKEHQRGGGSNRYSYQNNNNNNRYHRQNVDDDVDLSQDVHTNDLSNKERLYTPTELRDLVSFAKVRYNITIIPEISLPLRAGAWSKLMINKSKSNNSNITDLDLHLNNNNTITNHHRSVVVPCPQTLCNPAMNIPLDITNPQLPIILETILQEVLDMFQDPPYLHLGGDDPRLAQLCWEESIPFDDDMTTFTSSAGGGHSGSSSIGSYLNKMFVHDGMTASSTTVQPNYTHFEEQLRDILRNLNYPEERVIRWEIPPQNAMNDNDDKNNNDDDGRVGGMLHYWKTNPYQNDDSNIKSSSSSLQNKTILQKYWMSTGLALNSNAAETGWDVYTTTRRHLLATHRTIQEKERNGSRTSIDIPSLAGIIVGTWELGPQGFRWRNVIGRLIAISMAVYGFDDDCDDYDNMESEKIDKGTFDVTYNAFCRHVLSNVSSLRNDTSTCPLMGAPAMDLMEYQMNWQNMWSNWKQDLCHHTTVTEPVQGIFHPTGPARIVQENANAVFWQTLGRNKYNFDHRHIQQEQQHHPSSSGHENEMTTDDNVNDKSLQNSIADLELLRTKSNISYRGIIIDMVDSSGFVSPQYLKEQILENILVPFGLNTVQLRLVTNYGFHVTLNVNPRLSFHPNGDRESLKRQDLVDLVQAAKKLNINIVPEISITTDTGGWFNAGMLVNCPRRLCNDPNDVTSETSPLQKNSGKNYHPTAGVGGVVNDITKGRLLPVIVTVLDEFMEIFNSTPFLHLGSDERRGSIQCWNESLSHVPSASADLFMKAVYDAYDTFEAALTSLLQTKSDGYYHGNNYYVGYNVSSIIRWDNEEHVRYANRTGDITHYSTLPPSTLSKFNNGQDLDQHQDYGHDDNHMSNKKEEVTRTEARFFGTVHITEDKDLWSIYQESKQWTELKPIGLLAQIHGPVQSMIDSDQLRHQLFAFTIGTLSNQPDYIFSTSNDLEKYIHRTLCDNNSNTTSTSASNMGKKTTSPTKTSSNVQQWCQNKRLIGKESDTIMKAEHIVVDTKDIDLRKKMCNLMTRTKFVIKLRRQLQHQSIARDGTS